MMTTKIPLCSLLLLFGAAPVLALADDLTESVHLVVAGGPKAGTYDTSSTKGGCSYGFAGPGSWGNQLSSPGDPDPNKFNSLQLVVTDAKAAAAGSKDFLIVIGFGPLLKRSAEYTVETRSAQPKKTGTGTVTVEDHGKTAKVLFDVATTDGVKLKGTIDCKRVTRNGAGA